MAENKGWKSRIEGCLAVLLASSRCVLIGEGDGNMEEPLSSITLLERCLIERDLEERGRFQLLGRK